MTSEAQLLDKLRKITALFEGATSHGERAAAAAAIERIKTALRGMLKTEPPVEFTFKLTDDWHRRLFAALCRRYGLEPYRYKRQRRTTVIVRAPKSFIDKTLWPEYQMLQAELNAYLNAATERIIRDVVFGDAADARQR